MSRQLALPPNYVCPVPKHHKTMVLVSSLGKGTLPALEYAKTLAGDVEAVHVSLNPQATDRLQSQWDEWGCGIPLVILPSPYRSLNEPILEYLDEVDMAFGQDAWVTIVVPEFVTKRFWHNFLHNQTALLLKTLLRYRKGKIVTTVRFYLEE